MSELEAKQEDEGYPRKFGPYLLLNAFAHGGMGEVYLAKSGGIEGIDRLCVLKKLRPDVAKNKEYLGRFIDEARVVVQLSHANIAHVFDVGAVGDEHYMAMEYVSGANAREIQVRAGEQEAHGLDTGLAGLIVAEMLDALDYAHRHKHPLTGKPLTIVHRDVSPQNIMVSFEGEVKLIDFGLAASELKEEQTESQVVMGKVAYMSPEQARGEDCDPKTDQFAAAMVLYELLAGERFYGDKNNYEIWQVVGKGGFVPRKFTELEPEMTRILSKALSPDKAMRYPTCGDFKDELDIYVRTQHPHATKRTLRELMERLFERDQQAERKFLSQYADVSAAQVRAVAPGKARSFVAEGSSSAEAPVPDESDVTAPDAVSSDEASKGLPPHARTETAAAHPELMDQLDHDAPRAEGTDIIERDLTGAAMREALPSRRPVAAAAAVIVVLLLLVVGALLMGDNKTSGDGATTVADNTNTDTGEPDGPAKATPSEAPSDDKPTDAPTDAPTADAEDDTKAGTKDDPTVAASTGTAQQPTRDRRRATPAATTDKGDDTPKTVATAPGDDKPAGEKVDGDATATTPPTTLKIAKTDGEVTMSVRQSKKAKLRADLQRLLNGAVRGYRPGTNDRRVRALLTRCQGIGFLNPTQERLVTKMSSKSMSLVNIALNECLAKTGS